MPFALQFHYPFENKENLAVFPADLSLRRLTEHAVWFYSLTAVNVALFGKSPNWKI